jgi:hypothetical protein
MRAQRPLLAAWPRRAATMKVADIASDLPRRDRVGVDATQRSPLDSRVLVFRLAQRGAALRPRTGGKNRKSPRKVNVRYDLTTVKPTRRQGPNSDLAAFPVSGCHAGIGYSDPALGNPCTLSPARTPRSLNHPLRISRAYCAAPRDQCVVSSCGAMSSMLRITPFASM